MPPLKHQQLPPSRRPNKMLRTVITTSKADISLAYMIAKKKREEHIDFPQPLIHPDYIALSELTTKFSGGATESNIFFDRSQATAGTLP